MFPSCLSHVVHADLVDLSQNCSNFWRLAQKKGEKKMAKKASPKSSVISLCFFFFLQLFSQGRAPQFIRGKGSSHSYPTQLRAPTEQVPPAWCQCGHLQHAWATFGKCFLTRSAGRSICHTVLDKLQALALSHMKYVRMLCMCCLSNPPSFSAYI